MSDEKRGFVNVADQFLEKFNREDLVRNELAQEFRFDDERSSIILDDAFEMMKFLAEVGPNLFMRKSVEQELTRSAGEVLQKCSMVKTFVVKSRQSDSISERHSLLNDLQTVTAKLAQGLACFEADHRMTGEIQASSDKVRDKSIEVEEIVTKSKDLLQQLRDEVGKSVISSESADFEEAANTHKRSSIVWLVVVCILLCGLGVFIWFADGVAKESIDISFLIKRIGIVGCFATLIAVSVKSYSSQKHLETVSRHRARALATYAKLLEAAGDDPESRSVVLQRAAESVFELGLSGYEQSKAAALPNGLATQILKMTSKK